MGNLQIQLFGTVELRLGDRTLPAFPTEKSKSLFCFLALNRRRMFPRSVLLGQFWQDYDEPRARRNLRTSLWRVRSVVEPAGVRAGSYLRIDGDNVGFCPSSEYWMDVEAFEFSCADIERTIAARERPGAAALDALLRLYRSDLLDELYDDWCTFERERQRFAFLTALERLATHHAECEEWERALVSARLLLHHDPLREQVHRLVMRCHSRMGNRPAALMQYDACARLLCDELDTAPMKETMELRETIVNGGAAPPGVSTRLRMNDATADRAVDTTLQELDAAVKHLEHARERLSNVSAPVAEQRAR